MKRSSSDEIIWGTKGEVSRELGRRRFLTVIGALIYPLWWFIYRYSNPDQFDSLPERATVGALCVVLVILTYFSEFIRIHFKHFFILCASLLTLHHASLMFRNQMHQDYVLAMFLVVFAIAACLTSRANFAIYALVISGICLYASLFYDNFNQPVFIAGLSTGLLVSYLAVMTHLRMFARIVESEERFRTTADHAPVMIWVTDENGFYRFFNRQWLVFTGCKHEELVGNGWLKQLHSNDVQTMVQGFAKAFRERKNFSCEFRMKRHDGDYRRIFNTGVPRKGPDGSFVGYIGSCTDIGGQGGVN